MYFFAQLFVLAGFTPADSDSACHCYVESLKSQLKNFRQTSASCQYMELLRTFSCCGILLGLGKDFNFCLFFQFF